MKINKYCYKITATFKYDLGLYPNKKSLEKIFLDQVFELHKPDLKEIFIEFGFKNIESDNVVKNKLKIETAEIKISKDSNKLDWVFLIEDLYKIDKETKGSDLYKSYIGSENLIDKINNSVVRTAFYDKQFSPRLELLYPVSSKCVLI